MTERARIVLRERLSRATSTSSTLPNRTGMKANSLLPSEDSTGHHFASITVHAGSTPGAAPRDAHPAEHEQRTRAPAWCPPNHQISRWSAGAEGRDSAASDTVSDGIRSTIGGGAPIPTSTREFMEQRFRTDFSRVRIHSAGYSDQLSKRLNAQAFAVGDDIYFSSGKYQPNSTEGRHLLAHELTHVVQQAGTLRAVQRLIRTPFPWQGVITPAIGARIRSSPDHSDPSNILDSVPRGQVVNVNSVTGNWLKVESRYRGPLLLGYVHHTLVDDAASHSMEASVGTTMIWLPSGPSSGTDFEKWASAATETPFPAVTSTTIMNCWEAVLLAAYRAGTINWTWIHHLYSTVPEASWVAAMSRGPRHHYAVPGPNLKMPQRGDLVFFDGLVHVALATGTGSEVYTFWPPPDTPFSLPPGGTTDKVKVFTIEALFTWWAANMGGPPVVELAEPSW